MRNTVVAVVLVLTACAGGGGDQPPPAGGGEDGGTMLTDTFEGANEVADELDQREAELEQILEDMSG